MRRARLDEGEATQCKMEIRKKKVGGAQMETKTARAEMAHIQNVKSCLSDDLYGCGSKTLLESFRVIMKLK